MMPSLNGLEWLVIWFASTVGIFFIATAIVTGLKHDIKSWVGGMISIAAVILGWVIAMFYAVQS